MHALKQTFNLQETKIAYDIFIQTKKAETAATTKKVFLH